MSQRLGSIEVVTTNRPGEVLDLIQPILPNLNRVATPSRKGDIYETLPPSCGEIFSASFARCIGLLLLGQQSQMFHISQYLLGGTHGSDELVKRLSGDFERFAVLSSNQFEAFVWGGTQRHLFDFEARRMTSKVSSLLGSSVVVVGRPLNNPKMVRDAYWLPRQNRLVIHEKEWSDSIVGM